MTDRMAECLDSGVEEGGGSASSSAPVLTPLVPRGSVGVVAVKRAVKARDDAAVAWLASQSKKVRKATMGPQLQHRKAMTRADAESSIVEDFARRAAATALVASGKAATEKPANKFMTGQSVLQWWAPWMASASLGQAPKQVNRKNRPAWFSAEIISYVGYDTITYCGELKQPGHTYNVV